MTNESETSNSVPQLNNVTMNPEHSQETDADYYALKKWELGFLRVRSAIYYRIVVFNTCFV